MNEEAPKPRYSPGEEIANSVTHGLGTLLSVAGLVVMVVFAIKNGDAWHVVSSVVFGAALIFLYTASTLYHAVRNLRAKKFLQIMDHSAIFLLIAGTYTPLTLVTLRGPWGWTLFGVIWGAAVFGFILQLTPLRHSTILALGLYVGMGWVAVAAIRPLLASVPPGGLILLAAGGISYTGGIAFYIRRKLPFSHAVWHLFVLAGSILHFFTIFLYVIPWK
jgi:hemolysin III